MIRQCVILAGGDGTRLQPLWDGPKTLVPVKGKPFALYQLEWLARQGVWDVVYCAGQHVEAIREALGETRFGMRLTYVSDGPLRGTAGALRMAFANGALAPQFFVLYGDSYLRAELSALFLNSRRDVVMALLENHDLIAPSNVSVNSDLVAGFGEPQGRHIDYGIMAMRRDVVAALTEPTPTMAELLAPVIRAGRVTGFVADHRFYDVGTPQGVAELESFLDL